MEFSFKTEDRGGVCHITMTGGFDSTAGVMLIRLYDLKAAKAVINLKGIKTINSSGVRGWINFLQTFQQTCAVTLVECSAPIVSHMLMMPSFKSAAKIDSLYVDFFCPKCEAESASLLTRAQAANKQISEPRCTKCSLPMTSEEDAAQIIALFS
jgi:hypothetical protein